MSERAERRVLVIDDDELSREVLVLLLGSDGYAVTSASSGEEALAALDATGAIPELVLSDLQMPGLSGEELALQLRTACGPETQVIAMSGSRPSEDKVRAFDAFLLKPFSTEELASALERIEQGSGGLAEPSVERAGSEEALDAGIFSNFARMLGAEPLRELYSACLSDATKQLAAMRVAAESGQDEELRRRAHAMKGSLGMLGARELERMCSGLERLGMGNDYVATLNEFEAALGRLRRMLRSRGVQVTVEDAGPAEEYGQ